MAVNSAVQKINWPTIFKQGLLFQKLLNFQLQFDSWL